MTHCHITTASAQEDPISRLIDAIAATQGVYSKENTSSEAAEADVSAVETLLPNSIPRVATTLSFAMKPEIREVTILQSPNPIGFSIGATTPAIDASILVC